MASLIQDSRTGYFYVQVYDRIKRPHRKTISLGTKKRRIAERALARWEDAIALGDRDPWADSEPSHESVHTLGAAVDAYLASCEHLKPGTVTSYRDVLHPFQNFVGPSTPISRLSVVTILRWLAILIEANVHLGLRRGELVHLQWSHIDFDRRLVLVKNSGEFTTKSSRERTVPLCQQSELALRSQFEQRKGPFVFHSDGEKINPATLTRVFMKFRRLAKLPAHFNLHSTRHTFATWLAERGTPVTVIQYLMGHQSITTTERYMNTRADVAQIWMENALSDLSDW